MTDDKLYHYRATVVRVIDGDTIDVDIDLGCHIVVRKRLRLYGVDCPETRGPHASKAGALAFAFTASTVQVGMPITVKTYIDRDDKYGRLLARIEYLVGTETRCLNDVLLASGYATPMGPGGERLL